MSARSFRDADDLAITSREAFLEAIERAEYSDPRNGASTCAEWLRAIAYGIAATIDCSPVVHDHQRAEQPWRPS